MNNKVRKREGGKDRSVTVINDEFAGSFLENNTSDGSFPATGTDDCLSGETTGKSGFNVCLEVIDFRFGGRSE